MTYTRLSDGPTGAMGRNDVMTGIRKLALELRNQACRVAALTAAVNSSVAVYDSTRLERVRALASVAEEYADETLALADRCLSTLSEE